MRQPALTWADPAETGTQRSTVLREVESPLDRPARPRQVVQHLWDWPPGSHGWRLLCPSLVPAGTGVTEALTGTLTQQGALRGLVTPRQKQPFSPRHLQGPVSRLGLLGGGEETVALPVGHQKGHLKLLGSSRNFPIVPETSRKCLVGSGRLPTGQPWAPAPGQQRACEWSCALEQSPV